MGEFDQQEFDRETLLRLTKIGYAYHHGGINYGTTAELSSSETQFWALVSDVTHKEMNAVKLDPTFHAAIYEMPDAPPQSKELRDKRAQLLVKAMLKRAWDLAELAKMSVDDYQDFFQQYEYEEED